MASEREDVDHAINEADVSGSEQTVQTDSLSSVQPSFSYMQAMAGFMGVVEAPKAADPAAAAAAALEFLNTMWQEQEHDPGADSGGRPKTVYEETAHKLAEQVNVRTITRERNSPSPLPSPTASPEPVKQEDGNEEVHSDNRSETLEQWRSSREAQVVVSTAVALKEKRAGAAYLKRNEAKKLAVEQLQATAVAEQRQCIAAAKEGKKKSSKNLAQPSADLRKHLALCQEATDMGEQLRAVQTLKESIRGILMHMKSANELNRTRLEMKQRAHSAQEADFLALGINPYERFRRETLKAAKSAENSRHEKVAHQRKEQILKSLLLEEQAWGRSLKVAQVQKEYDETFQANQGGSAEEARISAYMRKTTKSHAELLDATGRNPVPASQAVRTKKLILPEDRVVHDADLASDSPLDSENPEEHAMKHETSGELAAVPELQGSWSKCRTDVHSTKESSSIKLAQVKEGAKPAVQKEVAAPCICDPPVLVFKDIDAGAQYQKVIKVTNTSSQLTAFRVLAVPAEHATILEVKQDRFGFISAGMAVKLTVYLSPEAEEDLNTEIEVLTDKGVCRVPVNVLCKKAVLSVSTSVLDLGCIPRGQRSTHQITITNAGALQAKFTVQRCSTEPEVQGSSQGGLEGADSTVKAVATGQASPFKILQEQGVCSGYASTIITVCFEPTMVTESEEDIEVVCAVKQKGPVRSAPAVFRIHLQGTGLDVPIKAENDVVDLKTCLFGATHREQVVLHNGAQSAMKVLAKVPACFAPFVSVSPALAFVQGKGIQAISVTVLPAPVMLTECAKFLTKEPNTFQFPVQFSIPEQAIPPTVSVKVHVSNHGLVMSPTQIDLGTVTVSEGKTFSVRITNKCCSWDSFSFLELPRGVSAAGGGCGSVAPFSHVDVDITFTPQLTGQHDLSLRLHSLLSSSSGLRLSSNVVHGPLKLSQNVVYMPATAYGSTTSASIVLSNTCTTERRYAFEMEDASELQVTPAFGKIAPHACVRLQLDFHPKKTQGITSPEEQTEYTEEVAAETDSPEADTDVDSSQVQPGVLESSASTPHKPCTWHLKCFNTASESSANGDQLVESVALEVHTCAVTPYLALAGDVVLDASRQRYVCDFGTVCTGELQVKSLQLRCTHNHDVVVSCCTPPHPLGPFEQVTACRSIKAGAALPFKLAFRPTNSGIFWEVVELSAAGHTVCCELSGGATGPRLQLMNAEQTEVDLGLMTANTSRCLEEQVSVTNPCAFPLDFGPELKLRASPNTGNMKNACYFHPARANLAPNDTLCIKTRFKPDWQVQSPALKNSIGIRLQDADVIHLPVQGKLTNDHILIQGASVVHSHRRVPPSIPGTACTQSHTREIVAQFSSALDCGETAALELQVVNTCPKTSQGSAELTISPLTPQDEDFGWTLGSTSIQVPNGESRPLQIGLKPSQALPDALKVCTGEQNKELRLTAMSSGQLSYAITVHAVVK